MAGKIIITEGAAPSAPVGTGKHTIYIDTADDKLKLKNEADDISIIATEAGVTAVLPAVASDAEVKTGSNTTKYLTPKTTADNYTMISSNVLFSRTTSASNGAVTYAHGLGKAPKVIMFHASTNPSQYAYGSNGSYAGGVNKCLYRGMSSYEIGSSSTYSMMYVYSGASLVGGAVTSVDATNFTITRTKTGSPSESYNLDVLATCFA